MEIFVLLLRQFIDNSIQYMWLSYGVCSLA